VIGLISGTSADGIDAVLVDISGTLLDLNVKLIASAMVPYPDWLHEQILSVIGGAALSMEALAALDDAIARQFAHAALAIQSGHAPADLIGSHGQTVFHRPPVRHPPRGRREHEDDNEAQNSVQNSVVRPEHNPFSLDQHATSTLLNAERQAPLKPDLQSPTHQSPLLGYSLQLGRGDLIAHLTEITTINNFRAADIALGGHGAPLVSRIDVCLFGHPTYTRCAQNIGGIGNLTYLPAQKSQDTSPDDWLSNIWGWDTGPGNSLIDLAVQHFSKGEQHYDTNGEWATRGTPCQTLVRRWLKQDFFQMPPPKSTGREEFGIDYLRECLWESKAYTLSRSDVLATLTELTAASIAHSYHTFLDHMPDQVLLSGGGSKNAYLRQRLQVHLDPIPVLTTDEMGINSDFKEAIAFAVLAYWRYLGIPGNLPSVTGAKGAIPLGTIHRSPSILRDNIGCPSKPAD
ncbi:MAG TPA: anhydro-N-acetylmuramic acid kinase, partial [Elainellaceae cyanobacterium]